MPPLDATFSLASDRRLTPKHILSYMSDIAFVKKNNACVRRASGGAGGVVPVGLHSSLSAHAREAGTPTSSVVTFPADQPFITDGGGRIAPLTIGYQTYGVLNPERSNAILVCHALTGDQHVANIHPVTGKPGWWSAMVGPGRPIDTDRFFVICSNVVGGCLGSSGPASVDPATGVAYGVDFPVITIRDMVRAQALLIDHLGIETLFCVAGGSMGGMQVLQWAALYPEQGVRGLPHRHRRPPLLPEHRLPRGGTAGDHGRSRLAERPLP